MASQENGPVGMYKLKPYFDTSAPIEFPECMYKLRSYHQPELTEAGVDKSSNNNAQSSVASKSACSTEGTPAQDQTTDPKVAELEKRQEAILARLRKLSKEVEELSKTSAKPVVASHAGQATYTPKPTACPPQAKPNPPKKRPEEGVVQDIVISASASSPPLSVFILHSLLCHQYSIIPSCHVHSSANGVPTQLKMAFSTEGITTNRNDYHLAITLIWKKVKNGPTLMVTPNSQTPIVGEASIARYLARLLKPSYDSVDAILATQIDSWVDTASQIASANTKERATAMRTLNAQLSKSPWLVGSDLSLADIVTWSSLQQTKQASSAQGNVKRWLDACNNHVAFQDALKLLSI